MMTDDKYMDHMFIFNIPCKLNSRAKLVVEEHGGAGPHHQLR
jgi:hypothetical protein